MSKGFTLWFTGLSGAGKSTLANAVAKELLSQKYNKVEILDGDLVRTHLSKGLGFSKEDRDTNIRRIGFVCNLLARNDVIAIASAISPYRSVRDEVRQQGGSFIEIFVKCPVEVCAKRDVKGLYAKAFSGEIKEFTGVSDPYEEPLNPELIIETDKESISQSTSRIINFLSEKEFIILPKLETLHAG